MLFVLPPGIPVRRNTALARLSRARNLLREERGAPVTIDDAAREAALSPYHFIRRFKAVFGDTPHQVLIDSRLERARHLLAMDSQSVTEICAMVGFSSLGTFSQLFANRVGVPPSAYRRSARALIQVPEILPRPLYPGCFSLMCGWPA
jgi:AraC-like DNA-binding protein